MKSNPLIDKARRAILKELNDRENARQHLIDFTTYTMPNYRVGAHHRLLCEKLEAVERGEIKRLLIDMPPRHGKSELASKRFPAWYLGRNPTKQIITTSYTADLASSFGRDVRNIIADTSFQNVFNGVELATDSKAKNRWHTNKGGIYIAAGIGGGITGAGADLAIIDDPIKDREEANSEIIREKIWNWYTSTLYTRLMKGGAIIVIQTRWHIDDLMGRLLDNMRNQTGEDWDHLHLPALAIEDDVLNRSPGDALWPDEFNKEVLLNTKKTIGELDFESLYQGSPIISTGMFFKPNLIRVVPVASKAKQVIRRWDLAATEKKSNKSDPDWTVGVKMQRNDDNSYTILDIVRFRGLPDEVQKTILGVASQDGRQVPIFIPQDPGQAGKDQALNYVKLLAGYRIETAPETGDKVTRASPFASQVNAGNVSIIEAHWNKVFLEELTMFPNGTHDDQVDASSGAFAKVGIKKPFPTMPSLNQMLRI